ncbi:hypothetical protein Tco_0623083 [Tanacetum coccineum]
MKHSKARNVIERCFGLLKGRWKILASPSFFPITTQVRIILACFLQHNLIRRYMRVDPQELEQDEDEIEHEEQLVEEASLSHISPTDEWLILAQELSLQCGIMWKLRSRRMKMIGPALWKVFAVVSCSGGYWARPKGKDKVLMGQSDVAGWGIFLQGSLVCLKDQGHMVILDQASGAPDPVPISALAVRARYGNVNDITKERILQKFWNNKLGGQTREKTITEEQEDPERCGETKTRAIIGVIVNKLPEEWFSGVIRDMNELEGIIDYLEPTLYDGFIDHNDEAYKQRRNMLLGMPYTEPPPIIKEEAEITKYNLRAGEKIFPIQKGYIGVNQFTSGKKTYAPNGLHVTPYFDECDGGDNPRENKEYWESSNDDMQTNLEWENLSFDNWVKVAFRKICKITMERINKDY